MGGLQLFVKKVTDKTGNFPYLGRDHHEIQQRLSGVLMGAVTGIK
jgi:hypothetical protein